MINRASQKLTELEQGERPTVAPAAEAPAQADLFGAPSAVEKALAELDPDELTPRQALERLYALKALGKGEGRAETWVSRLKPLLLGLIHG